jgi:hypothetical protein
LVNGTVSRKNLQILNRFTLVILLLFVSLNLIAQDAKKETWSKEKDYLKYERKRDFKGPDDWYGGSPASMKDLDDNYAPSNQGAQGLQYNPQQIVQEREKKYGKSGGGGSMEQDPAVKKPDPITLPEIDPPDVDGPDLPDIDLPSIPVDFWKIVLFLIIFAAVIILVYLWLKNRRPSGKSVLRDVENDWNPEVITKTELEMRLEEALNKEDYREGVRIYFTFILKELIRKNWIHWKKDKTNHHYVMEMSSRPKADIFRECVRIYDLVWYGEYEISKQVYQSLQPTLLNYYRSLESTHD